MLGRGIDADHDAEITRAQDRFPVRIDACSPHRLGDELRLRRRPAVLVEAQIVDRALARALAGVVARHLLPLHPRRVVPVRHEPGRRIGVNGQRGVDPLPLALLVLLAATTFR